MLPVQLGAHPGMGISGRDNFFPRLDETYLWAAIRYVGRNSVRAGMVRRGEQDPWSSAGGYCGLRHDATLTVKPAWRRQFDRVGDLASDG